MEALLGAAHTDTQGPVGDPSGDYARAGTRDGWRQALADVRLSSDGPRWIFHRYRLVRLARADIRLFLRNSCSCSQITDTPQTVLFAAQPVVLIAGAAVRHTTAARSTRRCTGHSIAPPARKHRSGRMETACQSGLVMATMRPISRL